MTSGSGSSGHDGLTLILLSLGGTVDHGDSLRWRLFPVMELEDREKGEGWAPNISPSRDSCNDLPSSY